MGKQNINIEKIYLWKNDKNDNLIKDICFGAL